MARLIKDNAEHFTEVSKYNIGLNSKYNDLFKHLLDCYEYKESVKIVSVEIQRAGFGTFDTSHYDAVPSSCKRVLVVLKQRGFTEVNLVLRGNDKLPHNIPVRIMTDGLYVLPPQMSELNISSGNTLTSCKNEGCRAIFVNMVVKCLTDVSSVNIANQFAGLELADGPKALDRVSKAMDEQGIDKTKLAEAMSKTSTTPSETQIKGKAISETCSYYYRC